MIQDKHPEMTNKWNREFWTRGYYVTTIGNVNKETVKKYIAEQSERNQEGRYSFLTSFRGAAFGLRYHPLGALDYSPYRAILKPPLEAVVMIYIR